MEVMDRSRLAAVALEVSFWACGRTVRKQAAWTGQLNVSNPLTRMAQQHLSLGFLFIFTVTRLFRF